MAQYDTTWFEKGLAELEITLNEKQIEQFLTYYELLVEWNKVMNLTAITDPCDVAALHLLDCAYLLTAADFRGKSDENPGSWNRRRISRHTVKNRFSGSGDRPSRLPEQAC